ncbi:hypothetical protein THAOC_35553 [Thalassiosira oceanica]|uniref:Uncharacterized protein n=1 Tax=Thalassiosira oceanica TaxID=159749 RepID=K0R1K4_THAOC|nr:hypothetical protein THAOC_35553 [Thalassiosira oceanica]|mmetsp:Transcript_21364/g.47468  ORF Transcript_21364/g.47468 Transcript_21364/m.47468 type:complete len:141 (+) Transcript_21364:273-695(+)|eukprot:EJK45815.1 hypothetical protein THAOC_35553 [Thalassiosira oceanica]
MATRLTARTLVPQAYSRTVLASSQSSSPARVRSASPQQQAATVRNLPTVTPTFPSSRDTTMQTYLINMTEIDRRICRKREEECEVEERRRRGAHDEEYAGLGIATGARGNSLREPDDVRAMPTGMTTGRLVVFEECPLLL